MALSQITTYQADALTQLAAQYFARPYISGLVSAVGATAQGLETALWQIYSEMGISPNAPGFTQATGTQLDLIGKIVNLPRAGWTDAVYVIFLQVQILCLLSSGTVPQILKIMSLLTSNSVQIVEYYPATMVVREYGAEPNAATIITFLRKAKPAGVRLMLEYSQRPLNQTFRFDVGPGFNVGHWAGVLE